ncbi:hypothetical protein [Actinocatenispora rupis]|uniref:Uncharacterized protein n=1 Tax=Actinocatenispora rupis TaxID=519421 RepID=A0A8J3J485_9ACTN|nr:hypothetical protein [Actinocatenispora rupis]GID11326.1 hypothetical protein Aru02nite_22150 [Actinocatenispora rupis]
MPVQPIPRERADQLLADAGTAYDRLAGTMYAIDAHPAVLLLRGGTVTGVTRRRRDALEPRITVLWAHFSAVGDLLEAARGVRGRRGRLGDDDLVELTALLREPVIPLDADGLPADGTGRPVHERVCLVDMLPRLTTEADALLAELSTVDAAAAALATALAPLSDELGRIRSTATDLGEPGLVAGPAAAYEALRDEILSDPLGAAPDGTPPASVTDRITALRTELHSVRAAVEQLDALRAGYPAERARLTDLLATVAEAETAAGGAYRVVAEKIADPGLPAAPASAGPLGSRFDELDRLHATRSWRRLGAAARGLERDITEARTRAAELRAAADGLLARRDELRGRLDAYRAKAARLGLLEDTDLARRHTAAQTLLYTAPCDLPAATRAVFAYQQALSAPREAT